MLMLALTSLYSNRILNIRRSTVLKLIYQSASTLGIWIWILKAINMIPFLCDSVQGIKYVASMSKTNKLQQGLTVPTWRLWHIWSYFQAIMRPIRMSSVHTWTNSIYPSSRRCFPYIVWPCTRSQYNQGIMNCQARWRMENI